MRRKKPDLLMVLAVLIGFGVLATEATYGQIFSPQADKTTLVSR